MTQKILVWLDRYEGLRGYADVGRKPSIQHLLANNCRRTRSGYGGIQENIQYDPYTFLNRLRARGYVSKEKNKHTEYKITESGRSYLDYLESRGRLIRELIPG